MVCFGTCIMSKRTYETSKVCACAEYFRFVDGIRSWLFCIKLASKDDHSGLLLCFARETRVCVGK